MATSSDPYYTQAISPEEVRAELSTIEQLISSISSKDEYLEAMLHGQRLQLMKMLQQQEQMEMMSGWGEITELPIGAIGRSLSDVGEGQWGKAEFNFSGSPRLVEVRADEDLELGDTIVIIDEENTVEIEEDSQFAIDPTESFRPVTKQDSVPEGGNARGLAIDLEIQGRPFVDLFYSVGDPATIEVYYSNSGEDDDWFKAEEIEVDDTDPDKEPQEGYQQFIWVSRPFVRIRCGERNTDIVLNAGASR